MSTATAWTEEATSRPDRKKIRVRIGGLHCSLCTATIEKALGRIPGVDKVAVSLTHEQALVEYDPQVARPEELLETLRDIGYTVSDPRKVRAYEDEERDLVREGRRFVIAVVLSVAMALSDLTTIAPWTLGTLAFILVFGVVGHILRMAVPALRRGILNQHVLLEVGAFAGIAGGIIGLVRDSATYPTGKFFAVSVMVATYHIFSERLSLIVKTRSSQAVKRLLDFQPDTARVVRNDQEVEVRSSASDRVNAFPSTAP